MNKEIPKVLPRLMKENIYDEIYLWDTNENGKPRLILKHIDGKTEIFDNDLYRFLKKAED